jgi:hypothetical protein
MTGHWADYAWCPAIVLTSVMICCDDHAGSEVLCEEVDVDWDSEAWGTLCEDGEEGLLDPAYGEIGSNSCVGMTGHWADYAWCPAIVLTKYFAKR